MGIMKPILFNTEMVRAVLDGRKTQTRRLPNSRTIDKWCDWNEYQCAVAPPGSILATEKGFYEKHPPYKRGDILWVRETWKQATTGTAGPGLIDLFLYKADEPQGTTGMMVEERWHPSIHMPKRAARIFLLVTNVRLEPLRNISEQDAILEGFLEDSLNERGTNINFMCSVDCLQGSARGKFAFLWDSTVKPELRNICSWRANPLVWVICFERIEQDRLLRYADNDVMQGCLMPAT